MRKSEKFMTNMARRDSKMEEDNNSSREVTMMYLIDSSEVVVAEDISERTLTLEEVVAEATSSNRSSNLKHYLITLTSLN